MSKITLFQLGIFSGDQEELLTLIHQRLEKDGRHDRLLKIFTPNPEQIVLAHDHPQFRALLRQADILIPDGSGLVFASKFIAGVRGRKSLAKRIAGVDVVQKLLQLYPEKKLLVVGGMGYPTRTRAGVGPQRLNFPHALEKLYWTPGFQDVKNPTESERSALEELLQKLKPEIVFVSFGAPAQEEWVTTHQSLLQNANVKVVLVVGGAFDVLTGKIARAPEWVQKMGGEWLFRLIQEPWRWKRQLRLITFGWLMLREVFR
jgi:N-acetylglucosaminyldiphosphoundecaprenol N-acetyl-beta-D-mannosaminyltransferase